MIEPPLHPLVRVVVLLVFITGIALAQPLLLFAACVCLLMAHMHAGFPESRLLFRMILRLRWLLLAILIVYGWWTPGEILFPRMGELSPTRQGLQFGVIRMLALICIVSAVHLLLQVTERGQLLTALMQLTRPVLSRGARERFAVRVLLTLEAVGQVQTMVGDVLKARGGGAPGFATHGVLSANGLRCCIAAGRPVTAHTDRGAGIRGTPTAAVAGPGAACLYHVADIQPVKATTAPGPSS